ncbi:hypothetical protein D3C76_1712010 [compost metagenome]
MLDEKWFEHLVNLSGRYAGACIADTDDELQARFASRNYLAASLDATVFGEFDCVAQ